MVNESSVGGLYGQESRTTIKEDRFQRMIIVMLKEINKKSWEEKNVSPDRFEKNDGNIAGILDDINNKTFMKEMND